MNVSVTRLLCLYYKLSVLELLNHINIALSTCIITIFSSPTPPRERRVNNKDKKTVECQTTGEPGLAYSWDTRYSGVGYPGTNFGLGFVDPTPIASNVVSPDALEGIN